MRGLLGYTRFSVVYYSEGSSAVRAYRVSGHAFVLRTQQPPARYGHITAAAAAAAAAAVVVVVVVVVVLLLLSFCCCFWWWWWWW